MHARREVSAFLFAAPLLAPFAANAAATDSVPAAALIQPAELAAILKGGGTQPVILQVGFKTLFDQAHIPGAQYAGPGNKDDGLKNLQGHADSLPRDRALVIYCGCCPWVRCPNVGAAYEQLHAMGFSHVQALYIADNFGDDWVNKNYPVTRGE